MTRKALAALISLACGCTVGGGLEPDDGTLAIESIDPGSGLRATLMIDGETITIESRLASGDASLGERLRVSTVSGEDGVPYATYAVNVDDFEVSGRFGDHEFGRATDDTSVAWGDVVDSRAGEVILAVAAAAADTEPPPGADEDLAQLTRMPTTLGSLAGDPGRAMLQQSSSHCDVGADSLGVYDWYVTNCPASYSRCWVYTSPTYYHHSMSGCGRTYYGKQYDSAGNLVVSFSQKGPTAGDYIRVEPYFRTSQPHGASVCRTTRWGDSTGLVKVLPKTCYTVPASTLGLEHWHVVWDTQ